MPDILSLTSEVQRLNAQYNLWGNILIGLVALTVFVGICSALASLKQKSVGNYLKAATDQLTKLKDEQRDREKQISDEKIALANAEAAKAEEGLAKANEKAQTAIAANAESRAETAQSLAEQENLRKKNLELQTGVANLEKEALYAKSKNSGLLQHVSPRAFTAYQRTRFLATLKQLPKGVIDITCLNGNAESCDFAQEIANLLKEAGWQVEGVRGSVLLAKSSRPPKGLHLNVKDDENAKPKATALLRGLNMLGLAATSNLQSSMPEGKIELLVGTKP